MATNNNALIKELIQSVYNGPLSVDGAGGIITIKVNDRVKVKADLYAKLNKVKHPFKDVRSTRSSFNVTEIKTATGNQVITIVYKQATSGGGSGAGAAITELSESAQCWYTAVAFNGKLPSQDGFVAGVASIKQKCNTDATIEKIVKELTDDWVVNCIAVANYMKAMAEFKGGLRNFKFHRGGDVVDKISAMFISANRKDAMMANINKWSPADIWLFTVKGETAIKSAPTDQTFASLNQIILALYESRDAIGVSLKKVGGDVHHEVFNLARNASNAAVKSHKVSDKSKDGYLLFSYKDDPAMSIQFRSFSDTGSWQGELKGKYANGGKIGGGQVAAIFQRVTGIELGSLNANAITKKVQAKDTSIEKNINTWAKELGVKLVPVSDQANDWKYSKYLTLELLATLKKQPAKHQEKFLREVIGYASSSTESSAVFIKIS